MTLKKKRNSDNNDGVEGDGTEQAFADLDLSDNPNEGQRVGAATVLRVARMLWHRRPDLSRSTTEEDKEFRASYGCGLLVATNTWNLLITKALLPNGGTVEHFLWMLTFMKTYAKGKNLSKACGNADLKTIRHWVWQFIRAVAELESIVVGVGSRRRSNETRLAKSRENDLTTLYCYFFQIIWENRFKGDAGNDCLVSVDGTDFRVKQLGPTFSSHKFAKKSGVRYEVALCIKTGDIVWLNGPFPCGQLNDISIFRQALMTELSANERVEADDGYVGESPQHIKCPASFTANPITKFMQERVRSRQETINNRFKFWCILAHPYRHDLGDHGDVFRAVAVVCQLTINQGERLFDCGYKDPPYN